MTARRRSRRRRRLLDDFAERSPLHAFGVGLVRFALMAAVAIVGYLVMMNLVIPDAVDNIVEGLRDVGQ